MCQYTRAESRVAAVLPEIFQKLDVKSQTLYSRFDEDELFDFMRNELQRLEGIGKVMATDSLRRNRVRSLPAVSVGVSVESGSIMLSLKGQTLSSQELADILGSYTRKKKYFRIRSGEFLSLDESDGDLWSTIAGLYRDYGKGNPENMKIPAFRAVYLKEMLDDREDSKFDATEEYRNLVAAMDPEIHKKEPIPSSLAEVLRPYQTEGFRWICMLKSCGFGGILADDMGLGKTLQILSFILAEKLKGKTGDELRTIVICPASLVYNWQRDRDIYSTA